MTTLFLHPAEREGFEPPDPRRSTVFKTAAFDRSAIFPFRAAKLQTFRRIDKFLLDRPTRAGDYKLQISRLKKRLKSRSILQNNSDQRKATPWNPEIGLDDTIIIGLSDALKKRFAEIAKMHTHFAKNVPKTNTEKQLKQAGKQNDSYPSYNSISAFYIHIESFFEKKFCHIINLEYFCSRFRKTKQHSSIAQLVRAPDC